VKGRLLVEATAGVVDVAAGVVEVAAGVAVVGSTAGVTVAGATVLASLATVGVTTQLDGSVNVSVGVQVLAAPAVPETNNTDAAAMHDPSTMRFTELLLSTDPMERNPMP
jgi:hypothetical protein